MNRFRKLGLLVILLSLISIVAVVPATYAIYKTSVTANVTTKTGVLVYDVILDEDPTYLDVITNDPYFFITVKNNKNSVLTDVDFDYNIVITNKDGSNGLYSYELDGGGLSTPVSSLTISGTLGNDANAEVTYKVVVTSSSMSETVVEYDVDYDIEQKNMNT